MAETNPFGGVALYHATVSDITDPEDLGRIKVDIQGFDETAKTSPFCHLISLLAGDGYGLFSLPQVGDEVIVGRLVSGDWVIFGYHWSKRKAPPAAGTDKVRLFLTPAGHQIKLDDEGEIEIQARNSGGKIVLKANGDIELNGADGAVVTTAHICAYTGLTHPQGSTKVKAVL